jgi:lipoprotein-anchoring transpeptidase ErfK/SrfK
VQSGTESPRERSPRLMIRGRAALAVAGALVAVTALAACTGGSKNNAADNSNPSSSAAGTPTTAPSTSVAPTPSTTPPAPAAVINTTVSATQNVNPAAPLAVSVTGGRLTAVKITNPAGKVVTGGLNDSADTWTANEALGYSKTYTLTATAVNPDGKVVNKNEQFTTLTPNNQTMPYLQILGGSALTNGAAYGVAIVPVVHFDEPITNKTAAMKALQVVTTPKVNGAWYWADDQDVHFRPQTYWPSGTKVTINANVYGVEVGDGLYGQSDVSGSFVIGRKQVTVANDSAPNVDKVNVYNASGQLIKTMNTSMGEHSGEEVNGQWINFYTPGGTYTVLDHENPAIMSSASYGLPASAPGGYAPEKIYYSTKISIDGIYLHELDTTVWAQNSGDDVSHGCLNLSQDNAIWFYNNSIPGDPVVINPTKGAPTVQLWEGGDWSVPWSTWVAGGLNN